MNAHAGPWMRLTAKAGIVVLMVAGSLGLWIGDPVLWLWITAKLEEGTQPSMGPYFLAIAGITFTAVAIAKALSRLNRLYAHVSGSEPTLRIIVPWRRSLRGERGEDEDAKLPVSVLDVVMVVSVVIAVIAFATWWIVVQPTPAGLPGGPGPAKH